MTKKILIVEDQFIEANNLYIILEKAGYQVCPIARSYEEAIELIDSYEPDLVLLDILLDGDRSGIDVAWKLREQGIAFIYLSANSNKETLDSAKETKPYGFLVKPFRKKDVLVAINIAHYLHEQQKDEFLRRESELSEQLTNLIDEAVDLERSLLALVRSLQPHIPADLFCVLTFAADNSALDIFSFYRTGFNDYRFIDKPELLKIIGLTSKNITVLQQNCFDENSYGFFNDLKQFSMRKLEAVLANSFEMRSSITQPLPLSSGEKFLLLFFNKHEQGYSQDHMNLFERWKKTIASSFDKIEKIAISRLSAAQVMDKAEKLAVTTAFKRISGNGHLILGVLDHIMMISKADTTVLVMGESGTGKELVVDAIQQLSLRSNKAFIKVNCAALPADLIESELFGHEKGAFTGATERRLGKFELANGGTLFLDEIGEMPFESQSKLLRVLQEREIERVGGVYPVKIDVRIIAATNRNLEYEVACGRFRIDLYYRLNVFPITMPSLRERPEDIPELIAIFLKRYAVLHGKNIHSFSGSLVSELQHYSWPGNVRQLESMVERAVLTSKGTIIESVELNYNKEKELPVNEENLNLKSLDENERDHILAVLTRCNGKISGKGGAAEVLEINVSTLKSRLKKLGIEKEKIISFSND